MTIGRVDPARFLGLRTDDPRGFWAEGSRYLAHIGVVATIEVVTPEPGRSRFARVSDGAMEALASTDDRGRPHRFFGGFAFRDDHRPTGYWREFPTARFILPEVELESHPTESRLTVRALRSAEDGEERVRAHLAARLHEFVELLSTDPPVEERASRFSSRTETDRALWEGTVEQVLRSIRSSDLSKVVLARTLDVRVPELVDPADVVMNLWSANQGTHVFLFEPTPGEAIVGAAPETVATLRDRSFRATAVAGSIGRGDSPEEQERLARELLESEKDRTEHEIALIDMVERLRPICEDVAAAPGPHVLTLSGIQHLETEITACTSEGITVLDLLETLHPTPAVCGLPRDSALDFLRHEEPFERGWYAGPVGWFDTAGDGVFAPALRCAVASGATWRLFAGAGIVEGSKPALEWEETRIKFGPVLRALAASGVTGSTPHGSE